MQILHNTYEVYGYKKALASAGDSLNFRPAIKTPYHHDKGIICPIGGMAPLFNVERVHKSRNKMNKNQIFNLIVEKTASVCGVTAEQIKSNNRRADIVDARCIAFCYATQEGGFTPRDIATLLGKDNPKAIRALCQSFDTRHARSYCFRELSASLRSEIRGEGYFQPSNKVTEKRP